MPVYTPSCERAYILLGIKELTDEDTCARQRQLKRKDKQNPRPGNTAGTGRTRW